MTVSAIEHTWKSSSKTSLRTPHYLCFRLSIAMLCPFGFYRVFLVCSNGFYLWHVVVTCLSRVVVTWLCTVMDFITCCSRMLTVKVLFSTCCSHMFITNTSVVFPRVPTSPRGTRKKIQQTQQVTMPTGSRSLDKRTLASLVVVRHLGDADRRNM